MKTTMCTLLFLILLLNQSLSNLVGIVTYTRNPNNKILVSAQFDDVHALIVHTKVYNDNEVDTYVYNFITTTYLFNTCSVFNCSCKLYDSILVNYFNVSNIFETTQYNSRMSRTLSIFFTGSYIEENVQRIGNVIYSKYWRVDIFYNSTASDDLGSWFDVTICTD